MIVKTPGSQAGDIMPVCNIDIRTYIDLILVIIKKNRSDNELRDPKWYCDTSDDG